MPLVDGGVELHSGIAAEPGGLGDLVHDLARLVAVDGLVVLDGVGVVLLVVFVGAHELVADADGVVGVLKEDRRKGLGVRPGAVVAGLDEGVGLLLLFGFALNEINNIWMVGVHDGHLGRAPRLAAGFDDPGKGVEATHEAQGAGGRAAAGDRLFAGAQRTEVGAGAGAEFEEQRFGARQFHNAGHRILN